MNPPCRHLPSANVANGGLIRINKVRQWSKGRGKKALKFINLNTSQSKKKEKAEKAKALLELFVFLKNFSVKGSLKNSYFHNKVVY